MSGDQRLEIYLNRRYDDNYSIHGSMVSRTVEPEYEQEGLNGRYFYVNDIVAFSTDVTSCKTAVSGWISLRFFQS